MKTCRLWMSWLCFVCVAFVSVGCYVPTAFKEDAFNIEGVYEVSSSEKVFGSELIALEEKIALENETGFFDVRMVWERKTISSRENKLFNRVRVTSERDYLFKRILLGAGYLEPDSVLASESRENLSFDGGNSSEITIASRFFRLKESGYSGEFLEGAELPSARCSATEWKKSISGEMVLSLVSYPEGSSQAQACVEEAKKAPSLKHQSFKYTFKGKAIRATSMVEGTLSMWLRTEFRVNEEREGSVDVRIWAQQLSLRKTRSSEESR